MKDPLNRVHDLRPDLIAARPDGRADPGDDILRARAERFRHGPHSRWACPGQSSSPARVRQPDGPLYGVIQQKRHTVGKAHHQRHAGISGDDPIRFGRWPRRSLPGADHKHFCAVHLPGGASLLITHRHRSRHPSAVFPYMGQVVTDGRSDVQRIERRGADSTAPREHSMHQPGMTCQSFELIIHNCMVTTALHGRKSNTINQPRPSPGLGRLPSRRWPIMSGRGCPACPEFPPVVDWQPIATQR